MLQLTGERWLHITASVRSLIKVRPGLAGRMSWTATGRMRRKMSAFMFREGLFVYGRAFDGSVHWCTIPRDVILPLWFSSGGNENPVLYSDLLEETRSRWTLDLADSMNEFGDERQEIESFRLAPYYSLYLRSHPMLPGHAPNSIQGVAALIATRMIPV